MLTRVQQTSPQSLLLGKLNQQFIRCCFHETAVPVRAAWDRILGGKNTMRSEPPLLTFLKPLFRLNRRLNA